MKSMSPGLASGLPTPGYKRAGPQVDEVVQAEAQLEQQFTLDDAGRDPGVARGRPDRAEEDGVAGAEIGEGFVRQGLPRFEPVLGAKLVVGLLQHDALRGGSLFEDLHGFGRDLGADAIAGNNGQINRGCAHVFSVAKSSTCWSTCLIIRTAGWPCSPESYGPRAGRRDHHNVLSPGILRVAADQHQAVGDGVPDGTVLQGGFRVGGDRLHGVVEYPCLRGHGEHCPPGPRPSSGG